MRAVVVVRQGTLPTGAEEAVNEAAGRVLLAGEGTEAAARDLVGATTEATCWESGPFRPGSWADSLAPALADDDVIVLPASADGRDLAPRLALSMGRPLHAPAIEVRAGTATVVRGGGLSLVDVAFDGPVVTTLVPGSRGTDPRRHPDPGVTVLTLGRRDGHDADLLEMVPADPATIDLQEAARIVAGGAGLGSAETMGLLGEVATALGCATGATRVVADAGWIEIDRQIGTTGVVVEPELYVAVGVSGAVQHVSGIGSPSAVVAVNTDPSCPMMGLADLAVVTDAPAFVRAMASRLGIADDGRGGPEATDPVEPDGG